MNIWRVKDLQSMLQRNYKPDQFIAFSIMPDQDIERMMNILGRAPDKDTECICCRQAGKAPMICLTLRINERMDLLWFCGDCAESGNIFVDRTPMEVFSKSARHREMTPNFKTYLLRCEFGQMKSTRTWQEFDKEYKR